MDEQHEPAPAEKDDLKYNRLSEYKAQSVICDQETRRLRLLENQKRKREETLSAFRNITEVWENSDDELENESQVQDVEFMEWKREETTSSAKVKGMLMLSEWMVKVPDDLEDKWLFTICPVGKRCLVRSYKVEPLKAWGFTIAFGKRGQRFAKFQSALPNGSRRHHTGTKYLNSEVTLLDCIWSSSTKSYFILDLLSWKGQFYMDTETSFRDFWIKSKLEETPSLSERSKKNPFPFIPLEHYPCCPGTISSVMCKYPYFPDDDPEIDGVLFYHSEAFYMPGLTPLVVWLKPFMLPEVLGIMVAEGYMLTKPADYVDSNQYIVTYTEKKKQKEWNRRRSRKREKGEGEKVEESSVEAEMMEN